MTGKHLYEYAIIRLVPRVEREEFINIGIILYCRDLRFLQTRMLLDAQRLLCLAPQLDLDEIKTYLDSFEKIALGAENSGPIGRLDIASRFRWLTAVRSTVIQTSRIHPGFCEDPAVTIEKLLKEQVAK